MIDVFIYELIDPIDDKTRYIGITRMPAKRYCQHLQDCKKVRSHKTYWIKKLLSHNLKPILNIIDTIPEYEIEFWEKWYIQLYKSWGINLTNSTSGGESNASPNEDVRKKMSKWQIGEGNHQFGKRKTEEQKINLSNKLKDKSIK